MNPSRPTAKQRLLWAALIGSTVLVAAAFGYLVTAFLYAFSGGQYRMVTVVNIGGRPPQPQPRQSLPRARAGWRS